MLDHNVLPIVPTTDNPPSKPSESHAQLWWSIGGGEGVSLL